MCIIHFNADLLVHAQKQFQISLQNKLLIQHEKPETQWGYNDLSKPPYGLVTEAE